MKALIFLLFLFYHVSTKIDSVNDKLSNLFEFYKSILKDPHVKINENVLMQRIKSRASRLILHEKPKKNPISVFSFIQEDFDDDEEEDQRLFTYQPFILTLYPTYQKGPTARKGHSTIIADTFMLVFGGCYLEYKCYNDIYFLDLRSHKWIHFDTKGQPPSPREGQGAVLYGTTLYVFGGNTGQTLSNELFSLNLETREWQQEEFKGTLPSPRTNIKAIVDDHARMIIFGGFTEKGYDNSLFVFDLIKKKVYQQKTQGIVPSSRENYGLIYINNRLWLFGGFHEGGALGDLYSIDTIVWYWVTVQTNGVKPPPAEGMSMTRVGKKIFITGGCDSRKKTCYSDNYILDTDSLWWSNIKHRSDYNYIEREGYSSVFFRGHLYRFGGCKMSEICFNDVHVLNIDEFCPNKCTDNGKCLKKNLGCLCKQGFSGHDCSLQMKCKNDCSKNGVCRNSAKCACFGGWTGSYCEVNLNCPKNCTSLENGTCMNNGKCKCKKGFKGNACEKISKKEINKLIKKIDISKKVLMRNTIPSFLQTSFNIKSESDLQHIEVIDLPKKLTKKIDKLPKNHTELQGLIRKVKKNAEKCKLNCNGNGFCRDSKCVCYEGFTSYDCSIYYGDFNIHGYQSVDVIIILISFFVVVIAAIIFGILIKKFQLKL